MYVKVSLIDLLKTKLVLIGQMQHRQEAEGRGNVLSQPKGAIDTPERGAAMQLLLHLLLGLQNRDHLPAHVDFHFWVGLAAIFKREFFEEERVLAA